MQLKIDEQYKSLIPALSNEEYKQLESNIVSDGCRDPIVVWGSTIIDGHNRYAICTEHGIEFDTRKIEFETEEDAKDWIDANQLGRRNLTPDQRRILIGRRYNREKKAPHRPKKGGKTCPLKTADKLAEEHKTSPRTVKNYAKDAELYERLEREEPETAKEIWSGGKTLTAAKREQKRKEVKEAPNLPDGKYRVLYADPPWKYNDNLTEDYGGTQWHYPSMSLSELKELPVKDMAGDNAVLFLWTTSPLLEESFEVVKAWGFKYKTSFVWDKIKHNMGHYNSVRHEFLLVCVKGSCTPDHLKLFDSVQSIERTEHSRKPEEFREIIDTLYTHGRKLELFRRGNASGEWEAWGNETE